MSDKKPGNQNPNPSKPPRTTPATPNNRDGKNDGARKHTDNVRPPKPGSK